MTHTVRDHACPYCGSPAGTRCVASRPVAGVPPQTLGFSHIERERVAGNWR